MIANLAGNEQSIDLTVELHSIVYLTDVERFTPYGSYNWEVGHGPANLRIRCIALMSQKVVGSGLASRNFERFRLKTCPQMCLLISVIRYVNLIISSSSYCDYCYVQIYYYD